MKAYTYQIGDGAGDVMSEPLHAEALFADSLGEAIEKAKAMTRRRPPHGKENIVRIVESGTDEHPLWACSTEDLREA